MRTIFQRRRFQTGEDGVSLILALVFILIVGLFATVALSKSEATLIAGELVASRSQTQYEIDGGIERSAQVMHSEMSSPDPGTCAQASAPTASGTLTLNSNSTTWSCTLLAGRAKRSSDSTNTDYAIVITKPTAGALQTSNGSSSLNIGGSVYMNSPLVAGNVKTDLTLMGDLVGPTSAGCSTFGSFAPVTVASGYLKTCTEQSLSSVLPTVGLPAAPTFNVSTNYRNGIALTVSPGHTCQVFFPGLYTAAPNLTNGANYFVSGTYYFNNLGTWQPWTGNSGVRHLSGGKRATSTDTIALSDDCSTVTDALAMALVSVAPDRTSIATSTYAHGVTLVLGGNSVLSVPKGTITLYSPPQGGSSLPMSLVAFDTATNGYAATSSTLTSTFDVVTGTSNNTELLVNGKMFAPSAGINIFSTNNTYAVAQAGLVAAELTLQASTSGAGSLAISTPGGLGTPAPPFRTVRIVSSAAGASSTNTAIVTISNFSPYTVLTKSWRTP